VTSAPAVGVSGLLGRPYKTIRLEWSSDLHLLRVRTCVRPIQCYSLAAMGELQQMLNDISANPGLVRHFVMSSDVPRVFNFGGDLALFVLLVRAGDVDSLKLYGKRCVDLVWWMENAANLGVHTTVLSQGDTLGGGLESVLPFHKVIFERSAQAGFPEVLFNLFPGMGAYSFLSRRVGPVQAERMITSGRLYSAEELHTLGLVDVLAEDGKGEAAVRDYIDRNDRKHNALQAIFRARRRANPVTLAELRDIVDIWSETALGVSDLDIRKMLRLTAAQEKRLAQAAEAAPLTQAAE
jgi:DSF synthase